MEDDWDDDNWDPVNEINKESTTVAENHSNILTLKNQSSVVTENVLFEQKSVSNASKTDKCVDGNFITVADVLSQMFPTKYASTKKANDFDVASPRHNLPSSNGIHSFTSTGILLGTNHQMHSNALEIARFKASSIGSESYVQNSCLMQGVNNGFHSGISFAVKFLTEVLDHKIVNGIDAVIPSFEHTKIIRECDLRSYHAKIDNATLRSELSNTPDTSKTTRRHQPTACKSTKKLYTPEEDDELMRIGRKIRKEDPSISDHKLFGLIFEQFGGSRSRQSIASRMQRHLADQWRVNEDDEFIVNE